MSLQWSEFSQIPLLVASKDPGVVFTTRLGGVSLDPFSSLNLSYSTGDDEASVMENRGRVSRALTISSEWFSVAQVHGNAVAAHQAEGTPVQADAAVTAERDVPVAIFTADCLPIALTSAGSREAVGAVHAGWRGLTSGVIENGVSAIRAVSAPDAPVRAWLGPCIGPCHYRVGGEVAAAFLERYPGAPGLHPTTDDGFRLDLPRAARWILGRCGAATEPDELPCTHCDPRFFSHRRDGLTGRQGVLVWRAGNAQKKNFVNKSHQEARRE